MNELPNQTHLQPSKRIILAKCDFCDFVRELRRDYYNSLVKNNKNICSSCAIKLAHSEGKCKSSFEIRSKISKERWANKEFRDAAVIRSTISNTTEEYKQSQRHKTLKLWSDPDYRSRVSAGVKEIMTDDMKLRISDSIKAKWLCSEDYRIKCAFARSNQNRVSKLQELLYLYLDDIGVNYHKEGDETVFGYYVFDCLIPRLNCKNLLVECQGDYWHSLPKSIRNDKSKFAYINRYFPEYEIMYLWEREFSTKDKIISKLKSKLHIEQSIIDFDFKDIIVKECSYLEASEFLDAYHYIGKGRGGICVGSYLNDVLIGCIVYSKKLRQNQNFGQDFRELSRLCIHPNYHKKNFGSWFISRSYKFLDVKLIIAFTDTTAGHSGAVYKSSNFELSHEIDSDYWYIDTDGFVMHKRTLYGQAIRMKMTEREYAENYGYSKKYGGKKICYIKQI